LCIPTHEQVENTMQYKTTTFKSQIVKEQPIDVSVMRRRNTNQVRTRA